VILFLGTSLINPSLNNSTASSILVTDSDVVSESIVDEPCDLTLRPSKLNI